MYILWQNKRLNTKKDEFYEKLEKLIITWTDITLGYWREDWGEINSKIGTLQEGKVNIRWATVTGGEQ